MEPRRWYGQDGLRTMFGGACGEEQSLVVGGAVARPADNLLTLVASALAGGDCIADAMRAERRVLGCTVKGSSTLGTFLHRAHRRSGRGDHARERALVGGEVRSRRRASRSSSSAESTAARWADGRPVAQRGLGERAGRLAHGGKVQRAAGRLDLKRRRLLGHGRAHRVIEASGAS